MPHLDSVDIESLLKTKIFYINMEDRIAFQYFCSKKKLLYNPFYETGMIMFKNTLNMIRIASEKMLL